MNNFYCLWAKRTLDVIISATLLVALMPLLALVAGSLWLKNGSPIFFRQERPGRGERTFTLIKFRTMRTPSASEMETGSDAERMTALGLFLRKTSVDELPELWNVLKGDMSLVGPRPLLVRYLPFYTPAERVRFRFRPGITGLAQIQGRNNASWNQRLAADVQYAQTVGFLEDLRILFATIAKVAGRKDVQGLPAAAMLDLDQERCNMPQSQTAEVDASARKA